MASGFTVLDSILSSKSFPFALKFDASCLKIDVIDTSHASRRTERSLQGEHDELYW